MTFRDRLHRHDHHQPELSSDVLTVADILAVPSAAPAADLPRYREDSDIAPLNFIGGYAIEESFFSRPDEGRDSTEHEDPDHNS